MIADPYLILLPLIVLALGGYICSWLFTLSEDTLVRVVTDFFMPMLVFYSLYTSTIKLNDTIKLGGAVGFVLLFLLIASLIYCRVFNLDKRAFLPPIIFMNSGFLVLWSIILGFWCRYADIEISQPLLDAFKYSGAGAPALAIFALGCSLRKRRLRADPHLISGLLMRFVFGFIAGMLAVNIFGITGSARIVVVSASALPSAVFFGYPATSLWGGYPFCRCHGPVVHTIECFHDSGRVLFERQNLSNI